MSLTCTLARTRLWSKPAIPALVAWYVSAATPTTATKTSSNKKGTMICWRRGRRRAAWRLSSLSVAEMRALGVNLKASTRG